MQETAPAPETTEDFAARLLRETLAEAAAPEAAAAPEEEAAPGTAKTLEVSFRPAAALSGVDSEESLHSSDF